MRRRRCANWDWAGKYAAAAVRSAWIGPVGLVLVWGMAGCASTSPAHRIAARRAIYESWPLEIRQAVLDGTVEIDMNAEMVRIALGEPGEIVNRTVGGRNEVVWIYSKVEMLGAAAPQPTNPTANGRVAAVNGSNAAAPAVLPPVAFRDREIWFYEGLVFRVGPKP